MQWRQSYHSLARFGNTLRVLLGNPSRYWRRLSAGIVCALFATIASMLLPHAAGSLLASPGSAEGSALLLLAGLLSGRALLGGLGTYWIETVGARAITDLRERLFYQFLRAPIAFHDQMNSASLVAAITSDTAFIQQSFGTLLAALAQHLPIVIAGGALLLVLNRELTLLMILASLPFVVLMAIAGVSVRSLVSRIQMTIAQMAIIAQESLGRVRVVKGLTQEEYFIQRFNVEAENSFVLKQSRVRWSAALEGVPPVGVAVIAILGVTFTRWQLATGVVTSSEVGTYMTLLAIVGVSFARLVISYSGISDIMGAAARIAEIRPPEVEKLFTSAPRLEVEKPIASPFRARERRNGGRVSSGRGALSFQNVSFQYPERASGVQDICLDIAPGEKVALVGPNGAGKSTLIHLLMSFYPLQGGDIWLDNCSIHSVPLGIWRRRFAIVTREPFVFNASVRANIQMGQAAAEQSDLMHAVRQVGLEELISQLPQGYNTDIGESGVRLSAGQCQRLALTRIFLQDPSVVILDEANTSLDAESATAFSDALQTFLKNRTLIFISHQPDSGISFDRVIYMDHGRLVSNDMKRSNDVSNYRQVAGLGVDA